MFSNFLTLDLEESIIDLKTHLEILHLVIITAIDCFYTFRGYQRVRNEKFKVFFDRLNPLDRHFPSVDPKGPTENNSPDLCIEALQRVIDGEQPIYLVKRLADISLLDPFSFLIPDFTPFAKELNLGPVIYTPFNLIRDYVEHS